MRKPWNALAALSLTGAMSLCLHAEGRGAYALRAARIVPVSGPVIARGTVVLRDGLIQTLGENVVPPADAWVIDCNGLTVYPGLIDALSAWGLTNSSPDNVGGRGGRGGAQAGANAAAPPAVAPAAPARGPEDRPSNAAYIKAADQIFPNDRAIETFRNGGFTSAATFPRGNIFSGQGSVINLAGNRAGEMVIADSVGQIITIPTGGRGGGGGRGFPSSLMGVIAYVRPIYLDNDHYKTAKAIYAKHPQGLTRPSYDRTLEGVLFSPRALLPASSDVEMERMTALTRELKLPAVLYGGFEAWRAVDLLKASGTPVLLSLKFPVKGADDDPELQEPLRVLELRQKAPSSAAALAKAGVKFAFYSDGLASPREIDAAVRKAMEAGLDSASAVRALTISPAEIYGVADRLGSIEPGKIANLVVTAGDLFEAQTKVKYVFVDGVKFEPPPETNPGRGDRGGKKQ